MKYVNVQLVDGTTLIGGLVSKRLFSIVLDYPIRVGDTTAKNNIFLFNRYDIFGKETNHIKIRKSNIVTYYELHDLVTEMYLKMVHFLKLKSYLVTKEITNHINTLDNLINPQLEEGVLSRSLQNIMSDIDNANTEANEQQKEVNVKKKTVH